MANDNSDTAAPNTGICTPIQLIETSKPLRLFKVYVRGAITGFNPSYVIATDPTSAYDKVFDFLERKEWGFSKERLLQSIELIAEASEYTATEHMLFL